MIPRMSIAQKFGPIMIESTSHPEQGIVWTRDWQVHRFYDNLVLRGQNNFWLRYTAGNPTKAVDTKQTQTWNKRLIETCRKSTARKLSLRLQLLWFRIHSFVFVFVPYFVLNSKSIPLKPRTFLYGSCCAFKSVLFHPGKVGLSQAPENKIGIEW